MLSASNHTKYVLLSNQKCMTQLYPNEYSQKLHYYPCAVNKDGCARSCNILNDLSNRVCAPNETENLNLHILNVMTGIKSKCECKFDGRKCNSNQK